MRLLWKILSAISGVKDPFSDLLPDRLEPRGRAGREDPPLTGADLLARREREARERLDSLGGDDAA